MNTSRARGTEYAERFNALSVFPVRLPDGLVVKTVLMHVKNLGTALSQGIIRSFNARCNPEINS